MLPKGRENYKTVMAEYMMDRRNCGIRNMGETAEGTCNGSDGINFN